MNVKLIRYTMDAEELAGSAAALCYDGKNPKRSLKVALDGHHESVMEHTTFTFQVEGISRVLLAQLTRHRLASFSVQSQRYVSMEDGMGFVIPPKIIDLGDTAINDYVEQMHTMHRWYKEWCFKLGGGKDALEDARFVLPGACTTKLIMTMNARELRHFFSLRCCTRAQGRFKTSFLNFLTPKSLEDYRVCSHINPTLTDYNTSNFLAEKFFVNVDDQMENIFGKDYNSMKAIISAPDITNRKLYRATHQRRKRIANFCGSVNESRFLRDSNNRRYLCFAITDIKPGYINIDMDSVWAEVKHKADHAKALYIFGKEDYRMIDLMNTSFEAPTEEAEVLSSIFKPADERNGEPIYYMQFTDIMRILRVESDNNYLKIFNMQTAMRKYGYQTRSMKMSRFDNTPRYLYPVQLIKKTGSLIDRLREYRKEE